MTTQSYDIIIVGAGPAGATCAYLMGKAGAKVLLIDKAQFPRDKTCGDFISARLKFNLEQLDLLPTLSSLPHAPVSDLLFTHSTVGGFLLNCPPQQGFICKRERFDHHLMEKAQAHCTLLSGGAVKKLLTENGQVTGVETEHQTFHSKIVVGADGANGITAKTLRGDTFDENHNAVAIRAYYTDVKGIAETAELHFLDEVQPGYFWIFPLNPTTGEANVGLGILSRDVRNQNVQLKQLLQKITQEHPQFRDRFVNSQLTSSIKGWSLPFGSKKRCLAFPGAVLLGDAAGLIDPMSGEGIENAVRSAQCAAPILLKALVAQDYSRTFLLRYQQAAEELLRQELRKSYWIQKLCRNPTMLKGFFHLLKRSSTARTFLVNKFFDA